MRFDMVYSLIIIASNARSSHVVMTANVTDTGLDTQPGEFGRAEAQTNGRNGDRLTDPTALRAA